MDNVLNRRVYRIAPNLDLCQSHVATGHLGVQRGIAELAFALYPFLQCRITRHDHRAGLSLRPFTQQFQST